MKRTNPSHELPVLDFDRLRDLRASNPGRIAQALEHRSRRAVPTTGSLFIVAADHPARGALAVGADPMAMANRLDLLQRLALALTRPGVDGVLATPDIIDDLALLGMLDDKIVVGSLNRGGLAGSTFQLDDRMTAYDARAVVRAGLDFGKTLLRIDLGDPGTVSTLEAVSRAVSEFADARVPIMVEPFLTELAGRTARNLLDVESVVTSVAIASGLGGSSAYTWLKLPVVPAMNRVAEASTLPIVLLGGDASKEPEELYARWDDALSLPGVRGMVAGRAILYPADGDVVAAVDTVAGLVHRSSPLNEKIEGGRND